MLAFTKLADFVVSALSLASAAVADPDEVVMSSELAACTPAGVHKGWATWYNVGLGACGHSNKDTDIVAAIGHQLYDKMNPNPGNPNDSNACKKHADVTWHGKTIKVEIVDRCVACGCDDLDLSPAAFKEFAPPGAGRLEGVSWKFD